MKTYACITEPKLTVCGAVIVGQKNVIIIKKIAAYMYVEKIRLKNKKEKKYTKKWNKWTLCISIIYKYKYTYISVSLSVSMCVIKKRIISSQECSYTLHLMVFILASFSDDGVSFLRENVLDN